MPDRQLESHFESQFEEKRGGPQTRRGENFSLAVTIAIAVAFCVWILSLPLFPTSDGPIHLLYARVMQALLFHRDPGILGDFYTIKHVAPPYSLYYYLLLIVGHFGSLVLADKVVICLYVVSFLFGFRFLARSIGPSGAAVAPLCALLLLNYPLGAGFVNFCLSTSLTFWTLGLWCRVAQGPAASDPAGARDNLRLIGFVVMAVVVMFTHPVPLAIMLGFCGVELAIRAIGTARSSDPQPLRWVPVIKSAIALAFASTTLIYVKAFSQKLVDSSQILVSAHEDGAKKLDTFHALTSRTHELYRLNTMDALSSIDALGLLRRGSLWLVLLFALGMGLIGISRAVRQRTWTLANTWTALSLFLFAVLPILPEDLNEAHGFADRLVIFIWLAALAGACGTALATWRARKRLAFASPVFAACAAALMLIMGIQRIGPVARQIGEIESTALPMHHAILAMIEDPQYGYPRGITFDPYRWSVARIARRSESIFYTVPWLEHSIIPVGNQPIMATNRIATLVLENPIRIAPRLTASEADRDLVFSHIDTLLVDHGSIPFNASDPEPILALDPIASRRWSCTSLVVYTYCGVLRR